MHSKYHDLADFTTAALAIRELLSRLHTTLKSMDIRLQLGNLRAPDRSSMAQIAYATFARGFDAEKLVLPAVVRLGADEPTWKVLVPLCYSAVDMQVTLGIASPNLWLQPVVVPARMKLRILRVFFSRWAHGEGTGIPGECTQASCTSE
jgi:hypothetical protein